jgi:hypothetical protein
MTNPLHQVSPSQRKYAHFYFLLDSYTPTGKEEQLYDTLVESFEALLAIEYIESQLGEG